MKGLATHSWSKTTTIPRILLPSKQIRVDLTNFKVFIHKRHVIGKFILQELNLDGWQPKNIPTRI